MRNFAVRKTKMLPALVLIVCLSACGGLPAANNPAGGAAGAPASSGSGDVFMYTDKYPAEPFYYSTSSSSQYPIGSDGRGYFLYGPERQTLNDTWYEILKYMDGRNAALTMPDGFFHCYIDREYDYTFAGYGILAGVRALNEERYVEISVSDDIGQNWRRVTLPLTVSDHEVPPAKFRLSFTSHTEGCLAAVDRDSAELFLTEDGGQTWRRTGVRQVDPLYAEIFFDTSRHFYIARATSQDSPVIETFDSGATWQPCRIELPPYFDEPNFSRGMSFSRSERGVYIAVNAYIRGHGPDGELQKNWADVRVTLIPREENGATVWGVDGTWNFDGDVNPYDFFRYLNLYHFEPGYYGVISANTAWVTGEPDGVVKECVTPSFLREIAEYALLHKPEAISKIPAEDANSNGSGNYYEEFGYLLSRQLVADMLALVYNVTDLDVTTLGRYRTDLDGFTMPLTFGGKFQGSHDEVYYVSTLPNGNIAVIFSSAPIDEGHRRVQRCVFRPVVSASGMQMFTLIECEAMEDYPNAAR